MVLSQGYIVFDQSEYFGFRDLHARMSRFCHFMFSPLISFNFFISILLIMSAEDYSRFFLGSKLCLQLFKKIGK
jgi:hypothetical protein